MNQSLISSTSTATFVVRFWREETLGEVRWRGRVEHVQSGEGAAFLELTDMLAFMEAFGISVARQPTGGIQDGP